MEEQRGAETPKITFRYNGNARYWTTGKNFDPYSQSLTTFRLTTQSLLDLLNAPGANQKEKDLTFEAARRVVEVALSNLDPQVVNLLTTNIVDIYGKFYKELTHRIRTAGDTLRIQQIVDSAPGSTKPRTFEVTGLMELELGSEFLDKALREPLLRAISPYFKDQLAAESATAEIGLMMDLARSPASVHNEAIHVSTVASFETFLKNLIQSIIDSHPNTLRASGVKFSAIDVLDADSRASLVGAIRTDVLAVSTRSYRDMDRFLKANLGSESSIQEVRDLIEARNVLVHHAGVVSEQYKATLPNSNYLVGDRLQLTIAYVKQSIIRLQKMASNLVDMARHSSIDK
ncbi:hypothetical protein AB0E55_19765 [Amycolatopsis keratiniphila]|uniref:hypothetical protein n=1 Tax=Amycolatopsis keratiniphila TaxID=129921 RepID=UPI0033FD6FA6